MADKYSTIKQHEPLRVPDGWGQKEKRLIAQLEEIFDDIYARFGRLKLTDMSEPLQEDIKTAANASLEISKFEDKLNLKADRQVLDEDGNVVGDLSTLATLGAEGVAALISGATPAGAVQTTHVQIDQSGVHLNTDGTFTVESGNFAVDGEGNLSCSDASINGTLLNQGQKVYTPQDIYIGTEEPADKKVGMIWVKPGEEGGGSQSPTFSQATHRYMYDQGSRLGLASNAVYGYLTGSATEAAGTKITYEIDIPVFIGGTVNGAVVSIELYGQKFTGTVSGKLYDHKTVHITAESSTWVANYASIPFILTASNNNVLNEKAGSGYQITVVSRSSS